jgi:hypothetical protein
LIINNINPFVFSSIMRNITYRTLLSPTTSIEEKLAHTRFGMEYYFSNMTDFLENRDRMRTHILSPFVKSDFAYVYMKDIVIEPRKKDGKFLVADNFPGNYPLVCKASDLNDTSIEVGWPMPPNSKRSSYEDFKDGIPSMHYKAVVFLYNPNSEPLWVANAIKHMKPRKKKVTLADIVREIMPQPVLVPT